MTYTELCEIVRNPNSYNKVDIEIADKKLKQFAYKGIHLMSAMELLGEILKLSIKIFMFYGGTAMTVISFIVLAAICTTEADVTTKTIVIEEITLVVGMVMAYVGNTLLEEERGKKNDKRKVRK